MGPLGQLFARLDAVVTTADAAALAVELRDATLSGAVSPRDARDLARLLNAMLARELHTRDHNSPEGRALAGAALGETFAAIEAAA